MAVSRCPLFFCAQFHFLSALHYTLRFGSRSQQKTFTHFHGSGANRRHDISTTTHQQSAWRLCVCAKTRFRWADDPSRPFKTPELRELTGAHMMSVSMKTMRMSVDIPWRRKSNPIQFRRSGDIFGFGVPWVEGVPENYFWIWIFHRFIVDQHHQRRHHDPHHQHHHQHHSSFIIHHSSFIIHHSSFITHHSSLITHHSSLITHHPSLITHLASFIINQHLLSQKDVDVVVLMFNSCVKRPPNQ